MGKAEFINILLFTEINKYPKKWYKKYTKTAILVYFNKQKNRNTQWILRKTKNN